MSITQAPPLRHPVLRVLDELRDDCGAAGEANAWSMTDAELREAVPEVARVLAGVFELQARLLAEADRRDLGDVEGHHDAAGWFAGVTRTTAREAKAAVRLARSLEVHEPVREALAGGRVLPEQARVIIEAVDALSVDLPAGVIEDAERHLAALAEFHDAKELRALGRRILEVVDPEGADGHERRLLEAEERRAAARTSFSIRSDGHGMMHGRFAIPELAGAMLKKHLEALAAPRHRATLDADPLTGASGAGQSAGEDTDVGIGPDGDGTPAGVPVGAGGPLGRGVSRPLRLGEAFVEYLTSRPVTAEGTPKAGGVAATVVVTTTLETLTGRLEAAGLLDTGERISPSATRMLACQAGIIPAVLGTRSQALDLGRRTRFHTEPQRIAIALRDKGCAEQHCDWPPGMCHIHHRHPWSRGGPTNLETGLMLCPRHHALAHDARYEMADTLHGKVRFTRRT